MDKFKAGVKTSEFWVVMAVSMVQAATAFFGYDLSLAQITGFVAPVVIYIWSRTVAKNAVAKPEA